MQLRFSGRFSVTQAIRSSNSTRTFLPPGTFSLEVAGQQKDVLIQAYERRILTYNPTNPAGFQVEMGNVGLHYFDWRYPNGLPPPVPTQAP